MNLSHTQAWAIRAAYRAREKGGGGWVYYSAGERHMVKLRTVRSLVRLGLVEIRSRSAVPDGFYGAFRLTLAGSLAGAELRSKDEVAKASIRARLKAAREAST